MSHTDAERYLGIARDQDMGAESKVLIYDARLYDGGDKAYYRSVIRDQVGLDQWKAAKFSAKA